MLNDDEAGAGIDVFEVPLVDISANAFIARRVTARKRDVFIFNSCRAKRRACGSSAT
jgi:hypothetical protein